MTLPLPRHDLPYLYKYTSAETAKKVISTQKFRWSSPRLFNDPFDHQTGVVFKFTGEELALALEKAAELAIFGDADFKLNHSTKYGESLRTMRAISARLPREEVMRDLRSASLEMARNFPRLCEEFNTAITSFLTHSRVLCLTETPDNVVMWSLYANEHRGTVFKLRRLEQLDHRFLVARNVVYTDEPVSYLTLQEYVENLVGASIHDPASRIWEIAYLKHRDWAYEREWRIHMPLLEKPAGVGFSDLDEPKELFEAIYLACRMEPETVADITRLMREHLPETEIYQARKCLDRIRLRLERVG